MRQFQRIKLVDVIYGSTYRRRCIDTTMNSHRLKGGGEYNYFVMQPTSNNKIIWIRPIAFILPPPLTAWHNNYLHRRHRTRSSHISNIISEIKRSCAAIDMWQSTSFTKGVVDNSDTHKTSVVTSLD
eukprot:scaffold15224_cov77-Skeletonema_dohrnii-CCMP3373.AAC.1